MPVTIATTLPGSSTPPKLFRVKLALWNPDLVVGQDYPASAFEGGRLGWLIDSLAIEWLGEGDAPRHDVPRKDAPDAAPTAHADAAARLAVERAALAAEADAVRLELAEQKAHNAKLAEDLKAAQDGLKAKQK